MWRLGWIVDRVEQHLYTTSHRLQTRASRGVRFIFEILEWKIECAGSKSCYNWTMIGREEDLVPSLFWLIGVVHIYSVGAQSVAA